MKPHTAQDLPAWISSRSQKTRPLNPAALLPSPAAVHFSGLSRARHPPVPWAAPFDQMALIRVLSQSCCSTIVIILNMQLFLRFQGLFRDFSHKHLVGYQCFIRTSATKNRLPDCYSAAAFSPESPVF
jgi:hypothetical protein